jgi:hypothetical protein
LRGNIQHRCFRQAAVVIAEDRENSRVLASHVIAEIPELTGQKPIDEVLMLQVDGGRGFDMGREQVAAEEQRLRTISCDPFEQPSVFVYIAMQVGDKEAGRQYPPPALVRFLATNIQPHGRFSSDICRKRLIRVNQPQT